MSYKKGETGNPSGRPKGALNKIGASQREFLTDFLRNGKEKFEKSMRELEHKDYVKAYVSVMQYVLPKPAVMELEDVPPLEAFIAMTKEERQTVIDEVQELIRNKKG